MTWLPTAFRIAATSEHKRFKHGSVILKGGAIQASGRNHGHRHAEINALSKMWPSKRRGCTLVSIRITAGNQLACGLPCPDCMNVIRASGVATVFYSTAARTIERLDF